MAIKLLKQEGLYIYISIRKFSAGMEKFHSETIQKFYFSSQLTIMMQSK